MDRGACLWLQSMALQRVGHNQATTAFTFHGNSTSESYDKNRISYELYESYSGFFFFEVSSNFLKAKIQQNVRYTVWFLL